MAFILEVDIMSIRNSWVDLVNKSKLSPHSGSAAEGVETYPLKGAIKLFKKCDSKCDSLNVRYGLPLKSQHEAVRTLGTASPGKP